MPSGIDKLMIAAMAGGVIAVCHGSGLIGSPFASPPPPLVSGSTPREIDRKLNSEYVSRDAGLLRSHLVEQGFRWCANSTDKHQSAYYIYVEDAPDLPIHTYRIIWTNTADGKIAGVVVSSDKQTVDPELYKGYLARRLRLGLTGSAISSRGKPPCQWLG